MGFDEISHRGLRYMSSDILGAVNCFTTRFGGVSSGYLSSLNLGENRGDLPENVTENYRRLAEAVGADKGFAFTRQIHGDGVRYVTAEDVRRPYDPFLYEADGIITDVPGLALIAFTADCTPILLHDPVANAVGAVHAGWRGTALGIAGKAVGEMCRIFGCKAGNIRAAIGPCISRCCFETGAEVYEAMMKLPGIDASPAFTRRGDKYMTDLKLINRLVLIGAGVRGENIDTSTECTYCSHDKYWSHRYTGGERGSQAAVVMMKGR